MFSHGDEPKVTPKEKVFVQGGGALGCHGDRRTEASATAGRGEGAEHGIFWADVGTDPALPPMQAPALLGAVPAGSPLHKGHSRATHSARGTYRKHPRQGEQASPLVLSKELITKYSCKGIRITDALK